MEDIKDIRHGTVGSRQLTEKNGETGKTVEDGKSRETTVLLELRDIRKAFGKGENRVEVLRGISLDVKKGEMSAMGEKELTRYRRRHLGYIFQMYNLIPNLTVRENIEVGAYLGRNPLDVDEILHTLGLYEHRRKLPNQLSGGQQQRTSIGRAIIKNPDILLCDEPTGALDYNTSREILRLIEKISLQYGTTIIMVTHNEAIGAMADTVIRLRDGSIRDRTVNVTRMPADQLEW